MTPARLHQLYLIGIALILAVGAFLWFRASERHAGAIAVLTHQNDSTIKVQVGIVQQTALRASLDSLHQQAALSAARQQVARQNALQRATDSLIQVSANERQRSERVLADSLATVRGLRDQLAAQVRSSVADSAAFATERAGQRASLDAAWATIRADSVSLQSTRAELNAVKSLADLRLREIGLLKAQAPSFLGRHASITVGGGCAEQGGNVACGPAVVAGWKVLP